MKRTIRTIVLALYTVLALTGCTGRGGRMVGGSEADSIYTWENIKQSMMEQPEHALGLIDTAEMRGLADINHADWMRAQVYYNAPAVEDMGKARDYCLQVLERQNPAADSVQKLKTLSLLVNICAYLPDTYQDAVRYAKQGAGMAHHAGDILQEANFYFEAGKVMERLQQGSGMDYMNRSMNILREASRDSIQPLPTLSSDLGNTARILAGQEKYAAAIPLLQEKLQVISRIEKENPNAPAGWADQQRAYTYPVLAYCQQMAGDKAGARRSAEAFEQTQAAREPINQKDMLNYYALAGNAGRIQQIYDRLEPLLREKEDTISWRYADLLYMYAMGLNNIGRYREAYQTQTRYQIINDSLVQRERQAETLELAQQMKTQERTQGEQLFLRLVELMKKEQPYTDSELNRDTLASMLATNHRYVDEAIRECSDSPSTKAFIDGYRVDHAARLLTDTDEPISLIAEMSGFANRTTFNERFRERYKMTPSEYRRAAKA